MENCNKSVEMKASLIIVLLLSSWNPLKMQFVPKFDYHHNLEHMTIWAPVDKV
jgi:hypothetical protein